jgi:methyl-accepting chemotaxis protein
MIKFGLKNILALLAVPSKTNWPGRLQKAVEDLIQLNTSTEREFLSLGERLQDYYLRTREISTVSSDIATRMSGQEITDAMERLRAIYTRVEQLDSKSRQGLEILNSILGRAEDIGRQLDCFSKVVKNLHVVCNLIKIETARIKSSDKEFQALVEDIKELAADIEKKSVHLFDQSRALGLLTRQNLTLIREFENKKQGQCRIILDGTMKNLRSLAERHELSVSTMQNLADQWNSISQSIGEVVASIQFHDITRQQIEHAVEALNGLLDKMPAIGPSNKGNPLIRQMPVSPDNGNGKKGSLCNENTGLALSTCRLQMAQIHHAGEELFSAVNRIINNLRTIADQGSKMAMDAKQITGTNEQTGHSFLSEMEEALSVLNDSLSDYAQLNMEMEITMGQVGDTVSGMSSFVKEIEKIGINMKKVALNAIIQAAHIGADGLPLSVLAESVHYLSVTTGDQINTIAGNLKEVIAISGQLDEKVQDEAENGWDRGDNPADYIAGMIKPLRRLDEDIAALLSRIDESGRTFRVEIEKTIEKITVHDRVYQGIEAINGGLDLLVNEIRARLPEDLQNKQEQDLLELAERYTMDREREIHHSLLAPEGQKPAAVTSAQEAEILEPPVEGIQKKEEDLGDNVELF